jgi:phospholipid transport system substrate-binding protein
VSRHLAAGVLRPFLLACLCGLVLLRASAEEAADGPDDVVRAVSQDIMGIIQTHRDTFDDDPKAYFDAVNARMDDFVDWDAIARAVMAGYWSEADAEQRERFIDSFRKGLVRSYARALLEFEQQKVEVLPVLAEHRRDDRALVRMEITGGNGRIYPLRYSMAKGEDGVWRVRNVIVDGVNLGLTYRNQFASAMQSGDAAGDIDAVIGDWFVPATPGG